MVLTIILIFLLSTVSVTSPIDEYRYIKTRNQISTRSNDLNSKEQTVNLYLKLLKRVEFIRTMDTFLPSLPLEYYINNVTSNKVYEFLHKLPKGGNLHLHEYQMLNRNTFLEIVFKQDPELNWLYICDKENNPDCTPDPTVCTCRPYFLKYFPKHPEKGWIRVKDSNWTIDKIVQKTTLINILKDNKVYSTDSKGRWKVVYDHGVLDFYSDLFKYNKTRYEYLRSVLDQSLSENVQLLEIRKFNFGELFYVDSEMNQIPISSYDEINMLREFKRNFIKLNPNFIDFGFIMTTIRHQDNIKSWLDNAWELYQKFPDMIRGFDMEGEEDRGHTLLYHSDSFMSRSFKFFFHAGETNWPEDLVPTLENLNDAIVLDSYRIGHGLGLIKRPDLYKYLINRGTAVEICPASNQLLGYVSDLRNHPGLNYYKSGVPIVLAGDDPGAFGYNELTVDYYLAFMAWGLDLWDLKQIANNSIIYSSVEGDLKQTGFKKFNNEWDGFINEVYEGICSTERPSVKLNFTRLLPSYGPVGEENELSLYGDGFETCLCQNVTCNFDGVETNAKIVDLNHIKCKTPVVERRFKKVNVQVRVGNLLFQTNKSYTFVL